MITGADVLFTYTGDSIISPHNYYFAGGIEGVFSRSIPLTGFHHGEIPVEKYAGLRLDADFEFHENLHFSIMTNVAIATEPGQAKDFSILGGYGFGIGYLSIIGPVKVGIMHGISSNHRYFNAVKGYISIGFSL